MGVLGYVKIGKFYVCMFLILFFFNFIILWKLEVIFIIKLDVCMGNVYVMFELNCVYMVLLVCFLVRDV